MNQSDLVCCVCEEWYTRERLPRNLNCGHSPCTLCLEKIIVQDKNCPECRLKIAAPEATYQPVNYPILRLATSCSSIQIKTENSSDMHPSSNRCKVHDSDLEFNFRECSMWVCKKCASSDHIEPPLGKCKIVSSREALEEFKNLHMYKFRKDTSRAEGMLDRVDTEIRITSRRQSINENEIKRLQEQIKDLKLSQNLLQQRQKQKKAKQSKVRALLNRMNQSMELTSQVSSVTEMLNAIETTNDCRLQFEKLMLLASEKDTYEDALILGDPSKSEAERKEVLFNIMINGHSLYGTFTWKDAPRWSQVTLDNNRLHIHALQDGLPPRTGLILPFEELRKLVPKVSPTVFLDVGWKGHSRGYVYIRMFEDTPRGQQMTYLCSGERGPLYKNTVFYEYSTCYKGKSDILRGGDYENNDGTGGRAIVEGITDGGEYKHMVQAGLLIGWGSEDPIRLGSFNIWLNANPNYFDKYAHGIVTEGLKTLELAAKCEPVTLASVMDCGLVINP